MSDSSSAAEAAGSPDSRADRLANERIDRELESPPPAADATSESTFAAASLAPDEKRRVADFLLLDALMASRSPSRRADVARALAATFARLRAEPVAAEVAPIVENADVENVGASSAANRVRLAREPDRSRRAFGGRRLLLGAGGLTVLALLGLLAWRNGGTNEAYAMVNRLEATASRSADRTYRVTIEPAVPVAPRREARLYVRGGGRFVFDDPGPLGVPLRFGSDGRRRWHMTESGPAYLSAPPAQGRAEEVASAASSAGELSPDAPYLRLETLLARLRERYELTLGARERLDETGPLWDRLSARRRDAAGAAMVWPESVEVWASSSTGDVQRLELRWSPGKLPVGPRSLVFEFESARSLGESFYAAESHGFTP